MSIHLIREVRKVQKFILNEGAMVEEAVRQAVTALERRDPDLAEQVIAGDKQIDLMELEVEEVCLALLALHQPVAHDLRYVVASLKINHDLERIGDLAVGVAKHAVALSGEPALPIERFGLSDMMGRVQEMIKQALHGYEAVAKTARSVLPAAEKANDQVTLDLLTQRLQVHEKTAWMLRSMLH